jgi:hypothetical protein
MSLTASLAAERASIRLHSSRWGLEVGGGGRSWERGNGEVEEEIEGE